MGSLFSQRQPRAALAVLLLALAGPAGARDGQVPLPPQTQPSPAQVKPERPLSPEDAELVQQLALVEHVELLRHLELFEKEPSSPQKKKKQ